MKRPEEINISISLFAFPTLCMLLSAHLPQCPFLFTWNGAKRQEKEQQMTLFMSMHFVLQSHLHVTVFYRKRRRLCGPINSIRDQCLSNMTSNNLCKAAVQTL